MFHRRALVRRIGILTSRGWAQHTVDRWRDAVSNRPTASHTTEIDLAASSQIDTLLALSNTHSHPTNKMLTQFTAFLLPHSHSIGRVLVQFSSVQFSSAEEFLSGNSGRLRRHARAWRLKHQTFADFFYACIIQLELLFGVRKSCFR